MQDLDETWQVLIQILARPPKTLSQSGIGQKQPINFKLLRRGRDFLSKSYRVGNLRQKRYKEKNLSINKNFCLVQTKCSISFLTTRTYAISITVLGKSIGQSRYQE